MNRLFQKYGPTMVWLAAAIVLGGSGFAARAAEKGQEIKVRLTGDQEVPPVKTTGSGTGTITIAPDKTVSGQITTTGVEGTVAHIHDSMPGQTMCGAKNGPVIVPLTKGPDNTWSVPAGSKLSDAQYESFKAENLYVNVHSAANKGGEICAQLKP